jgi:UPF0716 protein FxsA
MRGLFPFLLLALPVAELYVLIRVGAVAGLMNTIIALLIAATLGIRIVKSGSWRVLQQVQSSIQRGEPPMQGLLDSAMVTLGGVLLIVPGFITDLLALACLLPVTRRRVAAYLANRWRPAATTKARTDAIEGEFRRDD